MSTYKDSKTFKHWDDCQMAGCPGHTVEYEYQTTSDAFSLKIDGERAFGGDRAMLETFLSLINWGYIDTGVIYGDVS